MLYILLVNHCLNEYVPFFKGSWDEKYLSSVYYAIGPLSKVKVPKSRIQIK